MKTLGLTGPTHPTRDLYAPIALYGAAFLGLAAWAIVEQDSHGVVLFLLATCALAAIKAAVLVVMAFAVASKVDISFGTLPSAALKFGALTVSVDTARLWLKVFLKSVGAISATGKPGFGVHTLDWLCMLLLMGAGFYYLFELAFDQARPLIRLMLVAMLFIDALAILGKRALTAAPPRAPVATPTAPAAPVKPAAPAPIVPVAPATPPAPVIVQTEADREIDRRITSGVGIQDARQWARYRKDASRKLIDDLYAAGAARVLVDLGSERLIAELPAAPRERAACLQLVQAYRQSAGINAASSAAAPMNRFVIIETRRR